MAVQRDLLADILQLHHQPFSLQLWQSAVLQSFQEYCKLQEGLKASVTDSKRSFKDYEVAEATQVKA